MALREEYQARYDEVLRPLATAVEEQLREYFANEARIDRIQARAKSVERFLSKAEKVDAQGRVKYGHPLHQIQDQVAARITVFYLSDVIRASDIIERYYRSAEAKEILPESEWSFGYFGKHYVLLTPSDFRRAEWPQDFMPSVFELQIKTLFQHAWSEANHDLGYKPGTRGLEPEDERRIAFTSAQAWGADHIFDELFKKTLS
jgi:ppGpp synthetase/RelA/SpoT-type nucleotidyltranferase